MIEITTLFQLFSDETRLRILHLLSDKDLCVCELTEIMNESQPKISKHIAKLRTNQLVKTSRNEQYIYYSLNTENTLLKKQLEALIPSLSNKEPFCTDKQRLSTIKNFVCTSGESNV